MSLRSKPNQLKTLHNNVSLAVSDKHAKYFLVVSIAMHKSSLQKKLGNSNIWHSI